MGEARHRLSLADVSFFAIWSAGGTVRAGSLLGGLQSLRIIGFEEPQRVGSGRIDLACQVASRLHHWGALEWPKRDQRYALQVLIDRLARQSNVRGECRRRC
jgi:hypothetical protein